MASAVKQGIVYDCSHFRLWKYSVATVILSKEYLNDIAIYGKRK